MLSQYQLVHYAFTCLLSFGFEFWVYGNLTGALNVICNYSLSLIGIILVQLEMKLSSLLHKKEYLYELCLIYKNR